MRFWRPLGDVKLRPSLRRRRRRQRGPGVRRDGRPARTHADSMKRTLVEIVEVERQEERRTERVEPSTIAAVKSRSQAREEVPEKLGGRSIAIGSPHSRMS